MDKATAQQVERILRNANASLNEAILVVQANYAAQEFEGFRSVVGKIMGAVVVDVLPASVLE